MFDVGAGVDDVDVYTFAAVVSVRVFVEGAELKAFPMRDAGKTPWGALLNLRFIGAEGVNFLVSLDDGDLDAQ